MNKKFLITYDLKTQNWNYTNFFSALQNIGPWWHYLPSAWIIKVPSTYTAQNIHNSLASYISNQDHILIVEINSRDKWGWLPADAWTWIDTP